MKLPRNGNSKAKNILTKSNSVCGNYLTQLMGWMHLMTFVCIRRLMQDNAGRRTFSIFFKKDRFLDMMSFNIENAASHEYVVQMFKRL